MPKSIALGKALREASTPRSTKPVWAGPAGEGTQGGVTSSLLSRYLVCRERFRIQTIEGLTPPERFNARMDYGTMWHACEEALAAESGRYTGEPWLGPLDDCCQGMMLRFPMQRQDIGHWQSVCKALFPVYVAHWKKHPDVLHRKPLFQEQVFDITYQLPSGRFVRLRGKFDSVDLIGKGKDAAMYLQENKSKSAIDGQKVERQLTFDLQTMIYGIALVEWQRQVATGKNGTRPWAAQKGAFITEDELRVSKALGAGKICGVRYNVVKRSSHKCGKKETYTQFMERIAGLASAEPGEWFGRWKVEVSGADMMRFRHDCLDPVLENLLDDYAWWHFCKLESRNAFDYVTRQKFFGNEHLSRHFRFPYGIYHVLAEGGEADVDNYINTGSTTGLVQTTDLFPELRDSVRAA